MFSAAKVPAANRDALAFRQMQSALLTTHHVFRNTIVLPGRIPAIGPDQQINHIRDSDQQ